MNRKKKMLLAVSLGCCLSMGSIPAAAQEAPATNNGELSATTMMPEFESINLMEEAENAGISVLDLNAMIEQGIYSWELSADGSYYALKNVLYVGNPTDPENNLSKQSMNIFLPAAYMNEDGTINTEVEVNGYTVSTAPIIYKNGVSGYAQADPVDLPVGAPEPLIAYLWGDNQAFLDHGYIVVSPGSRGKETASADGTFIGKSPAALVDLKAGIRFLKYNADSIPGDTSKIISVGMSAGGAMSSLIAATGNNETFLPYLEEIGAVTEGGIGDDVYAAQCFCPVTDLDHADIAYEWCFGGDANATWAGAHSIPAQGELNEFQKTLSADLAQAYVDYLNGLNLGLTLDDVRSGSYYDAILAKLSDSLNDYLAVQFGSADSEDAAAYITSVDEQTGKVDYTTFASFNEETGLYEITDLDAYVTNYRGRLKMVPAFDNLWKREAKNQEFGDATTDTVHFDADVAELLAANDYTALTSEDYQYDYSEFSYDTFQDEAISGTINLGWRDGLAEEYAEAEEDDVKERVQILNVMNYLEDENVNTENVVAPYVRIRVGSHDSDTSFSVSYNIALALEAFTDTQVDYGIVWGEDHGYCNDVENVMNWVDQIAK